MTNTVRGEIEKIAAAPLSWEKLSGKTLLVTGATGFIGSFIIRALMLKNERDGLGVKVIALVRSEDKARSLYGEYEKKGMLTFLVQDVCEALPTDRRADFVIHCASNAAPREYSLYPVETMKTNFFGTMNLLDYAKAVQAESFLYVSTIEIYGTTHGLDTIPEDVYGEIDAMKIRSCYPLSKKGCETLCASYADEYGLDIKIGRLSYIFGPGMKPGDSKIVALFPKCIADGENIVMKSKGEQLRSYTYVTDAITGLLTVLLEGKNGEAYNIASKLCITTIAGIAHTLVDAYPEKGLKVIFDLPTEQEAKGFSLIENAVLSSEKLENLGWQPETDLVTGLKKVVEEQIELKG
ncbi:MAG: NAD-dependent epimerase/dehydratase family protein [Oscillospiraceae bacterium]|nr:NAD-dependent epimerase/dehydratase family protein [Oscillospiraceae bacterium]